MNHLKLWVVWATMATVASFTGNAYAKVEGDTIVLGAAISETGKYSTNGMHTKNGYDLAVEKINANGGVEINGKTYKLRIIYYDDESTPARAAQLASFSRMELNFCLALTARG